MIHRNRLKDQSQSGSSYATNYCIFWLRWSTAVKASTLSTLQAIRLKEDNTQTSANNFSVTDYWRQKAAESTRVSPIPVLTIQAYWSDKTPRLSPEQPILPTCPEQEHLVGTEYSHYKYTPHDILTILRLIFSSSGILKTSRPSWTCTAGNATSTDSK